MKNRWEHSERKDLKYKLNLSLETYLNYQCFGFKKNQYFLLNFATLILINSITLKKKIIRNRLSPWMSHGVNIHNFLLLPKVPLLSYMLICMKWVFVNYQWFFKASDNNSYHVGGAPTCAWQCAGHLTDIAAAYKNQGKRVIIIPTYRRGHRNTLGRYKWPSPTKIPLTKIIKRI